MFFKIPRSEPERRLLCLQVNLLPGRFVEQLLSSPSAAPYPQPSPRSRCHRHRHSLHRCSVSRHSKRQPLPGSKPRPGEGKNRRRAVDRRKSKPSSTMKSICSTSCATGTIAIRSSARSPSAAGRTRSCTSWATLCRWRRAVGPVRRWVCRRHSWSSWNGETERWGLWTVRRRRRCPRRWRRWRLTGRRSSRVTKVRAVGHVSVVWETTLVIWSCSGLNWFSNSGWPHR